MSPASPPAIHAEHLVKHYGTQRALDDFTLTVPTGSIHGLLGPNGAGKTTAVNVLSTLTALTGRDTGTARIAGTDIHEGPAVRERIGLVGQYAAVDEALGGHENLVMFARLLGLRRRDAHRRADELLEQFDLTDAAGRTVSGYSGGMRRRLDIAVSLIRHPDVLFLDEPTTGLDPRGRSDVWDAVLSAARAGTTVLLTTQYLEEADRLADRISIMTSGRVVAEGTPGELKRSRGGDRVDVTFGPQVSRSEVADALCGAPSAPTMSVVESAEGLRVSLPAPAGTVDLVDTVRRLDAATLSPVDIALRRPTLDEVFLAVTDQSHEEKP
ncbi:ATP-binding cassette domain-containing protein [Corynebacterium sp.]|uniref:ATP-binding cassette domain-containing protein n=1 Tax=Corynebacterium sp. TaxID=1720 RepID=UPI0025C4AF21|nr:ATP-binding cassette domain-containing protein [Corynebacterium sp.]